MKSLFLLPSKSALRQLLSTAAMFVVAAVHAQDAPIAAKPASPVSEIVQRYPAGSIGNVVQADEALERISRERKRVESEFKAREEQCYDRFFMTSCIDKARERRREELALLRPIEVEANAFKRRATVEERDRRLAERKAEYDAEEAERAKAQPEREAARQKRIAEQNPVPEAQSDSRPEPKAVSRREEQGTAKPVTAKKPPEPDPVREAEDAKKREENVANYEKKVKQAEIRQKQVAARKAERERKRERERIKKESAAATQ